MSAPFKAFHIYFEVVSLTFGARGGPHYLCGSKRGFVIKHRSLLWYGFRNPKCVVRKEFYSLIKLHNIINFYNCFIHVYQI